LDESQKYDSPMATLGKGWVMNKLRFQRERFAATVHISTLLPKSVSD
jgi:hypothetical protein